MALFQNLTLRKIWFHVNSCSIPILPALKPNDKHQVVQDLSIINPYAILAKMPEGTTWFIVLDLKYAFFYKYLYPESHYLFTCQWTDPDYTLTVLHQIFRDSLALICLWIPLTRNVESSKTGTLLQNASGIHLCNPFKEELDVNTIQILIFFVEWEYKVSSTKVQISKRV